MSSRSSHIGTTAGGNRAAFGPLSPVAVPLWFKPRVLGRAGWRLEQAERERTWALVSARAEGISIRLLIVTCPIGPAAFKKLDAIAVLRPHCYRTPEEHWRCRAACGWFG